jgi:AcrR family transcriptional regulator
MRRTRRTDQVKPSRRGREGSRGYKPHDERRGEIIAATIAILAEHGLHAWKTAELARRVGVSEPTLFRHFKDKQEILTAAIRQETKLLRERITQYEGSGSAWDTAQGLVLSVLDFLAETGGGPLVIVTGQLSRISPGIRRDVLRTLQMLRARLMALFREALDQAADPAAPDAAVLADLAVAVIQSTGLRWIMSDRRYPLRAAAEAMLGAVHRSLREEA